jgi:predicted peptidase
MQTANYLGSPYILRVPDDYTPTGRSFPLLVYLSGGPGIALDAANGSEDTLTKTDYLVLYPHAGGAMWWEKDQAAKVRALLDEIIPTLNIDPSRIYLTGFSNGGTGTLYYATLWPEQFSAIAPLMGAATCIDDISPLKLDRLGKVPVLLVHGDKDPIIPSSCSEDAYKKLRKISPASELHILKGREHDITLGTDDGLTLPFLQAHPRCTTSK